MPPKPFPRLQDGPLGVGDVPVNLYPKPDPARKEIIVRTPGLLQHCQLTDCTEGRGIYSYQGFLYCILRRGSESVVWRVDPVLGTAGEVGTIPTSFTGPVWIKDNPTQLGISDGVTKYVFTPASGSFVPNSDLNFPGSTTLDSLSGLGLYVKPNSNQWGFMGLYDFNSIDPLNFYSFESKTGNIVGLVTFRLEVYVLAVNGGEVWYFYGGDNSSADNPTFARNVTGIIPYGCGAIGSINTADESMVNWISNQGEWVAAAGYQTGKISNQMMDEALKAMPTFADARAYSWRDGGHVFTAMTFTSGAQTWVYDWTTKALFKLTSYLADGSGWGRHRLNCICKLNNELFGLDYENGTVYKVSRDYFDDDTHEIQRVLHSIEYDGGNDDIDFGKMSLLMKMGIGLTGETFWTKTTEASLTVTVAVSGGNVTFTRSTGDWTTNLATGNSVVFSGFSNDGNNDVAYRATGVTALVVTALQGTAVAEGPTSNITVQEGYIYTEPQVMYSYSNDSGKTYSSEMWRGCGFIGEYKKPVPTWNRNGQSRKRIFRFSMTDPVDWEIYALDLEMQALKG